jgi:cytochrome c1
VRRPPAFLLVFALAPAACGEASREHDEARLLLRQFGCGACHVIPGVADAQGRVGPSLAHFGARSYVAGVLPNTAANVERFIRDPRSVDPRTAMPDLQVGEAHARRMAAYLETLR